MNVLIELVKITKTNTRYLSGKMLALVEAIQKGKIQSNEDAIDLLFKESASSNRSLYYLIERTKRILLVNALACTTGENDYQRAHSKTHSGFASVMVLMTSGKNTMAPEARKIFRLATKYELIHIASALALRLTKYYAEIDPDRDLQKKYSIEAKRYLDFIHTNTLATTLYSKSILKVNDRTSYSSGTIKYLRQACKELEGQNLTVEATGQYYILRAILSIAKQDYAKAALVSKEGFKKLENQPAFQTGQKLMFLSIQSIAAIAAKQNKRAESSLLQAIGIVGSHAMNWQIFTYYRALNAMHQQQYFKVLHLKEEAARRKQLGVIKEHWAILEAYLFIFDVSSNQRPNFRLGKFFNETIEASHDKGGHNINIILIDLLISLRQNRDRFLHRLEAVRTYRYRYLKGKPYERVRLFLDLLFQLPRCDFNLRRLERATTAIHRKLERRSMYATHNMEVEVVPFEHLWDQVLLQLAGNKKGRRILK